MQMSGIVTDLWYPGWLRPTATAVVYKMTDHENFVILIFGFVFHKISNTASHKDEYLHFSQAVVSCYTTRGGCNSSSYRSSWFIVIIVLRLSVASQEDHVWESDSVPPVIVRSFSYSSSKPWPSIPSDKLIFIQITKSVHHPSSQG